MHTLLFLPLLFGCGAESALLQAQIDNLSDGVTGLTTTTAEHDTDIAGLTTRVDTLELTTVPGLIETAVSALESSIVGEITRLEDALFEVQNRVGTTEAATVPPGTIVAFAGHDAPEGWLLCDGDDPRRDEYEALHDAIGETWGDGDGATTFNVPDLRGQFLRGADATGVRDPDAASRTPSADGGSDEGVGTVQDEATASHSHYVSLTSDTVSHSHSGSTNADSSYHGTEYYERGLPAWTSTTTGTFTKAYGSESSPDIRTFTTDTDSHSHSVSGAAASTGGSETRPTNAAVLYIIKT